MRIILVLLLSIVSLFLPSYAEAISSNNDVTAIEKYLNGISTLKAEFIQTTSDGQKLNGTFFAKAARKLRFEYAAPIKDFIVADGTYIHYYDSEMKQRSSISIDNSLANFLLRKNINFSSEVEVTNLITDNNSIELTLTQKENPLSGSLTLFLTKEPLKLHKWQVVDAQGIVTYIELKNLEFGNKLDDELFYYYDPEVKKILY